MILRWVSGRTTAFMGTSAMWACGPWDCGPHGATGLLHHTRVGPRRAARRCQGVGGNRADSRRRDPRALQQPLPPGLVLELRRVQVDADRRDDRAAAVADRHRDAGDALLEFAADHRP